MTQVICDVTKKVIKNAVRDQNYYTFRYRTLSEEAKEEIESIVKDKMKNNRPYTMKSYWKTFEQTIEDLSK